MHVITCMTSMVATHTPHGDGNLIAMIECLKRSVATHTPHGDGNMEGTGENLLNLVATHTPHGDGNTSAFLFIAHGEIVATHTPHGDGNVDIAGNIAFIPRCNSHPSRGRKLSIDSGQCLCSIKLQLTPLMGTETKRLRSFLSLFSLSLNYAVGQPIIY